MRRKSRIDEGTEYYSLVRALQAIDEADVGVLVIDATEGVTHQDQRLAERVDASGCPIVILLNKWELLNAEQRLDVDLQVRDRLHFLSQSPVLKGSALSGKGVHRILPALQQAVEEYHRRVPTRELNKVLQAAQAAQPAPQGRILYGTQGTSDPPTFTLFTSRDLPASYMRYLERKIREHFNFGNTPLKLRVRRRSG
jgi:GTP-binding protein